MKYVKKPIQLYVSFAKNDGVLSTLEGMVPYKIGDAIVTGVRNEKWPIVYERFRATYEPIDKSLKIGNDGLYVKKPIMVNAFQVNTKKIISISDEIASLTAEPGDWIVEADDGSKWVVKNNIFIETYLKITEGI